MHVTTVITTTAMVVGLTRSQGYIRMGAGQSFVLCQLTRYTYCPTTFHSSKVRTGSFPSSNWFFSLDFVTKILYAVFVSPVQATV
jgi:hypothetical protein